jgi:uncharacterized protein involved in response to NO
MLPLAALAWIAGYTVFTISHLPMLLGGRIDGRTG